MVSINHGFQNPAYGLGQMTAVAVGAVGLEVAKEPFRNAEFYAPNKSIANFLWREANERANTDGSFNQTTCFTLNISSGLLGTPYVGCWDAQKTQANGYRADMFPVAQFYSDYNLSRSLKPGTTVRWAFDSFNAAPFSNPTDFYGAGRYESYYTMPYLWLDSKHGRPAMHGRPEYYAGIKRISYYVTNTGTGTPMATATTRPLTNGVGAADRSFTIVDLNQGDLVTGDPVAIRNQDGWYWQAANGGGSTVTSSAISSTGNARFTIVKISADAGDPIAHNDLFALKTADGAHYLVAPQGGAVSATSTSIVTDEQFRLERLKTE